MNFLGTGQQVVMQRVIFCMVVLAMLVGADGAVGAEGGTIELLVVDERGQPIEGVILGKRWVRGVNDKEAGYPKMVGENKASGVLSGKDGRLQVTVSQVFGSRGKRAVLMGVTDDYGMMGVMILEKNRLGKAIVKLVMKKAGWVEIKTLVGRLPNYLEKNRKIRVRAIYGKMKALGIDLGISAAGDVGRGVGRILLPVGDVSLSFESSYEIKMTRDVKVRRKGSKVGVSLRLTDQMKLVGKAAPSLAQMGRSVGAKGVENRGQNGAILICFLDFSTISSDFALEFLVLEVNALRAKGVRVICICRSGGEEMEKKIEAKRVKFMETKGWPFEVYVDRELVEKRQIGRRKLGQTFADYFVMRMGTGVLIDKFGKVAGILPESKSGKAKMLKAVFGVE